MPTPLRNNGLPPTTAPARPAATTPAAPAPAPAAPPAAGRGWSPGAVAGRVAERLANAGDGKTSFDLIPGRAPNAVGLPQVLLGVGASPQGQATVKQLLAGLEAKTGIKVPEEVQVAALQHPEVATKAFEVTPKQIQQGMEALNTSYKAGKTKQVEPRALLLPQKFDLGNLDALPWTRPVPELKELAPGLFTGSLPSTTSDADLKRTTVMAEVFQRLSTNPSAAAGKQFEVQYGGRSFRKLDDFTRALAADGYQVKVSFEERVANFADLKTVVPNTHPPQYLDVPAPLMVKTGIKDAQGQEALVPAAHSEMMISISSGPDTRGPKLDSTTRYFQGMNGTGFFPAGGAAEPAWCGRVKHAEVSGAKALEAVGLAGTFTDVVQASAKKLDLYADGYGLTGVCNDSVAVVEQALTGKAHEYPLLMKDSVLASELKRRLGDGDKSDDAACKALKKAIAALPSDVKPNASSRARALASIPWGAGQEPFGSTVDARRILSGG